MTRRNGEDVVAVTFPPSAAEPMTELWALLHRDAALAVHDCEIHCLTAIALSADDDLIAQLLLRKLRMARKVAGGDTDPDAARMNSFVAFSHGANERRFCQLVHPRAAGITRGALGIDSATGAGLIGLHPRQSVLWPDSEGRLSELTLLHVDNGCRRTRDVHAPQVRALPVAAPGLREVSTMKGTA